MKYIAMFIYDRLKHRYVDVIHDCVCSKLGGVTHNNIFSFNTTIHLLY